MACCSDNGAYGQLKMEKHLVCHRAIYIYIHLCVCTMDNRPIPHVRSVKLEHNATSSLAISVLGKHARAKLRANLKNNIVFYLLALQLFALK